MYDRHKEVTNQFPKGIKAVSKKENKYERHAIQKAGYKQVSKQGTPDLGYLTMWKRHLSDEALLFVEKPDGFFRYGGIVKTENHD